MDRFDPFVKYADVYGDIINWEKDPMNKPQNQNKYFFSDGKTYYEQICKMLRLMSVFKEAFNQIYSNEDEISEAWENFVNNLSASVVEGSEPDVTLTWTDDSVNFEFTMVPGVPGEQGVGITSISFNSDYTMTITLSDGNSYTSMSLKGETGPQGPQGETGSGLQILDVYATLADLQSAHPTGQPGDAYQVGSAGNYTLYIWSSSQSAWVQAGTLGTVSPSTSAPLMDGTASAGSQNLYARGDHVHPSDTSRASKEELDALIKTSQSLIDQSFIYRESPAIQDGLARFDKIKGNTLVWNQLVPIPTSDTSTTINDVTITDNRDGSYTLNGTATANGNFIVGSDVPTPVGHKFLVQGYVKVGSNTGFMGFAGLNVDSGSGGIWTNSLTYNQLNARIEIKSGDTFNNTKMTPQFFDLTKMFGSTKADEIYAMETAQAGSGVAYFKSLFPLDYYSYSAGSLLSFNGSGLKTSGKNLINANESYTFNPTLTPIPVYLEANKTYTISYEVNVAGLSLDTQLRTADNSRSIAHQPLNTVTGSRMSVTMTPTEPVYGLRFYVNGQITVSNIQIEYGSTATSYEPYKESSLSIPISQYFPTGMKSAGSAYDELTDSKAVTRIGAVDLGTLSWYYSNGLFLAKIDNGAYTVSPVGNANGRCVLYEAKAINPTTLSDKQMTLGTAYAFANVGNIVVKDSAYTSASAFKTSMNGVMLYYELATSTETSIDIDLSFKSYLDGTEQLLPVNGSVPSTSPIIADMTYLSIDDAMEYILDKLANVPLNTQQILESLEDDVADLQTDVGALQPAVSALQTSVGNINTNIGQISSTVAGNTSSISDIQSDISDLNTGLGNLEDTVTDNTSRIGTLENGLSTTNGNVENLSTSVSDLDDTVTAQGTTVTALDSIISDISNNPVVSALGSHELGFVAAYVSATLAANTGTKVTIPKPVIFPNNYTPLFIVGMSTGSYNVSICEIPYTFGNRDSVDCRVWNHGGQQTTQITVYILCMRQRQSQ